MVATSQTVAPTEEPLDIEEAKLHLRVTADDENASVALYIKAAREAAEVFTGRQLVTATWEWKLDAFSAGALRPPFPNLVSVTSIQYVDTAGATQTFSSSKYAVDTHSEPGRIYLAHNETWPDTRSIENAVTVTFVAGYGAATAVPAKIKLGMLQAMGGWWEKRESTVSGMTITKVPLSVEWLWEPYQMRLVGGE